MDKILAATLAAPRATLEYTHAFAGGVYQRTMTAKAGTFIVGATHKTSNFFAIVSGTVSIWDETNGVRKLTGPYFEAAPVGIRRLAYAHTDCVCMNFFNVGNCDGITIGELEDRLGDWHGVPREIGLNEAKLLVA